MISFDEFINKYNGKLINNGGTQCVAVFNEYTQKVVGIGWIGTPITGYADDLWTQFGKDSDYLSFTTIDLSNPAQKGDVAIWYHYNGGTNLPHVAVVIEDLGDSLKCLTQNPGNAIIANLTKKGLAGYLRPKMFINAQPITSVSSDPISLYVVKVKLNGYITANDAANHINSNSFIQPGSYAIFSTHNDMINITSKSGQPGWWINPGDNIVSKITEVETPAIQTSVLQNTNFNIGDVVVPTQLVDYNGSRLVQYDDNYTITSINGDRAVLSARGHVWCAINIVNIKHI